MPGTYKIGEAAALLNLKTYVLRFWETEFPQIAPLRTETGRRVYTAGHLALLERIRFLLHERGLTIDGARRILHEEAAKGVRYAPPAAFGPGDANPAAPVDPALFDSPGGDAESQKTTHDAAMFQADPAFAGTPPCDTAFLREIRAELEHVASLLTGRPLRGDDPA